MRVAVVNMAWQMPGNKALLAQACADQDIVLVCEALKTGGKAPEDLSLIAPEGWLVAQVMKSASTGGSAVLYREASVKCHGAGLVQMSRRGRGVRARHLLWVDLEDRQTGDRRRYAATHAPLLRTGRRGEFYRNLRLWLDQHPKAVVGLDGNMAPMKVGKAMNRKVVGREVMSLLYPAGLAVEAEFPRLPGSDHPVIRAHVQKAEAAQPSLPTPPVNYIRARWHGGPQRRPKRIVLHSTVGPTKKGSAKKIADMFHTTDVKKSAHAVVDAADLYTCLDDLIVAYHCGYNQDSLGLEMCDMPDPKSQARWSNADHQKMFNLAVKWVAQKCVKYDIPPYYVGVLGLHAGRGGVTTHADMSKAFKKSTHWDPGAWPRRKFMSAVRAEVKRIKETR